MHEQAALAIAVVLFAGILCQWLAWRIKLPAILFLLMSGIVAGPVFGWLQPDELFGHLFFPFVSLSVAVILFEGSLTLRFREIPGLERVIRNLITSGMLITWGISAVTARILLDFSWEVSFLFGALMVVTGPTVIVPMLRTVRPNLKVAHILRWEGILIDPIGAVMAVLVYEFIISANPQSGLADGLLVFGKILAIGVALGGTGGWIFGQVLRRHWLPHFLHNFAALAMICLVFALSNLLEPESGLLSVTLMGILLANMKNIDLGDILGFKESLSLLLISMLFILLAARMDINSFIEIGWPALGVFMVIQFLARPLNAQFSALGSTLTANERHLLAWIAPRGIVAAAISALFANKLEKIGYPAANQMVSLTFMVIVGTVLLQSATAGPIARWLKVAEPDPKGLLIIGANALARAVALALKSVGFRVFLTDQNWEHITAAKMEGLPTYWGNPVSEHAERHVSLIGIGKMIALTSNPELNALAAKHYRLEFGANNLYSIRNHRPDDGESDEKVSLRHGGQECFDGVHTYRDLVELVKSGTQIKTTALTDKFSWKDFQKQTDGSRVNLFAVSPNDLLYIFTPKPTFTPEKGWQIICLDLAVPVPQPQNAEAVAK